MRLHPLPILALTLAAALVGCSGEAPDAAPSEAPITGPDTPPGITLSDARVQLPLVTGRPGVAYFTVSQGSGAPRAVAAVSVAGVGRSEIHETREENGVSRMAAVQEVALGAGQTVKFAPGGYHVMLFDVGPSLKAGGTTELTVTFDNGDKATASAAVTSMGQNMGGMDMKEHAH